MTKLAVIGLMLLAGCARTAVREDGSPGRSPCPELTKRARDLDTFPSLSIPASCSVGERCSEGPWDCRCLDSRGGASRPASWECHRARGKRNGCPDDAALLSGAPCTLEGQSCSAPRACGCAWTTEAVCMKGRWQLPACEERCLAP